MCVTSARRRCRWRTDAGCLAVVVEHRRRSQKVTKCNKRKTKCVACVSEVPTALQPYTRLTCPPVCPCDEPLFSLFSVYVCVSSDSSRVSGTTQITSCCWQQVNLSYSSLTSSLTNQLSVPTFRSDLMMFENVKLTPPTPHPTSPHLPPIPPFSPSVCILNPVNSDVVVRDCGSVFGTRQVPRPGPSSRLES